jgi:hypothetical protein
MSELDISLLVIGSMLLGNLSIALGAYVLLKRKLANIQNEFILPIFDDLVTEITTNEDFQRKIYTIGALIGKGAVDGSGVSGMITKPAKGKGGLMGFLTDMALQAVSNGGLSKIFGNSQGTQQQGNQQQKQTDIEPAFK